MCSARYVHWVGVHRWSAFAGRHCCSHWRGLVHVTSDLNTEASWQTVALTNETFLLCGSPYCSSHWIGRSVIVWQSQTERASTNAIKWSFCWCLRRLWCTSHEIFEPVVVAAFVTACLALRSTHALNVIIFIKCNAILLQCYIPMVDIII